MKKVISFSLYGDRPRYTMGAVRNAQLAATIYPGWECWFYCADDVPASIALQLQQSNAKVIFSKKSVGSEGMFWRFYPFAEADVSHVLVRDTDSRLSRREATAVSEWLESGAVGHIIRDHPAHAQLIMGGMWGAQTQALRPILHWINAYGPSIHYNSDQEFLACCIYPKLLSLGLCVHDPFYRYEPQARPLPLPREEYSFIGEVLDETDSRPHDRLQDWLILAQLERSRLKRLGFMRHRLSHLVRYWLRRRVDHKIS